MSTREAVVDACADLRRATIRGRRAPYKPIVLLWAIGRLWEEQGTGERLVPFKVARDHVVPIFEQFGRAARSRVNPIDPLWRGAGRSFTFVRKAMIQQRLQRLDPYRTWRLSRPLTAADGSTFPERNR